MTDGDDASQADGRPTPGTDVRGPVIIPMPDGEAPPGPHMRWCVFVGAWCKGSDCYCELTLFA